MSAPLLITNGTLCTWQPGESLIEGGALYLADGLIADLGPAAELEARYPDAERLDAGGQLVMPGLICAHTHFYGAFARGMGIPGAPAPDFPAILKRLWWPLDQALDEEGVRYSALVCLVDAVKHGATTLIDHHASPNALAGSLDVIAAAVGQAGLRAVLCYEVTDRYGPQKAQAAIDENLRFITAAKDQLHLAGTMGLHASLTLSQDTLEASYAAASAAGVGVHIHVGEHEADQEDSLKRYSTRVISRLGRHGLLGPQTIAAHCVHIDEREAGLLRETNTWVTHQPRSNMNNAVGAAPVEALLSDGVRVCLGNDGFSNAMWQEWKAAYLLHKAAHRDPRRMNGADVVQMAVHNNTALAAGFFPHSPPGYLKPGAAADVILVDYQPTTPLTAGNLPWHILFGLEPSAVTATICAGQVLMRDRKLLTLDEAQIAAESRRIAAQTWERYAKIAAG